MKKAYIAPETVPYNLSSESLLQLVVSSSPIDSEGGVAVKRRQQSSSPFELHIDSIKF